MDFTSHNFHSMATFSGNAGRVLTGKTLDKPLKPAKQQYDISS